MIDLIFRIVHPLWLELRLDSVTQARSDAGQPKRMRTDYMCWTANAVLEVPVFDLV